MQNSEANVTIELVPTKTFLLRSKNRQTLLQHVAFLRNVVKNFNGEVEKEVDYVDEVMMIFRFTDFECCQAFTELVQS